MKASEYIKMLEDIIRKYGDLEVKIDKADGTMAPAIPYVLRSKNCIVVAL